MDEEKAREIAIQILDEFEELLGTKGIMIPSDDREGREEEACLYGSEYYELEDAITDILVQETAAADCSRMPPNGPNEEARAACEAMRRRMVVVSSREVRR